MLLVNNRLAWQWEGVIHEAIYSPVHGRSCAILEGVTNMAIHSDGHRSKDPEKHKKDAAILQRALQKEPQNQRYVFFLAQSYYQAKDLEKALHAYQKRSTMGGFDEEIYFSYYMAGRIMEKLGYPPPNFIDCYQRALTLRPQRAEPIYRLGHYYLNNQEFEQAYLILKRGLDLTVPSDSLNIERDIYDFGIKMLFIDCARHLNYNQEAKEIFSQLTLEQQNWFIEQSDNR
jgi:tetratricopeptide (TPR) repeat protein